ncbi:hypothetical protein Q1695_015577 [Nippostrongylus brasiliensis]|nr:hypothetical protein Q1695_015577 [Nippostrongylus brasiliensis]
MRLFKEYAINVSSFLGYTLLFPLCLIAFSILGLAGILGSWKFSMGVDRYDYRRYRRGVVANAIGSVILSAAYSSIIICSALCFITAICFLLAFATMLICMGMFGDNDLRFLQTIPQLRHTVIIGDQVLQYSLHDIFRMCKNGHAFFNAINGSYSTVQSEVMKHAAVNALPQCDALTEIWTTFGYYVCISISLPTQGLWVACMICVIGSSGIYNALFNTGRFLHQYAVITQAIVDRRRMREAKSTLVKNLDINAPLCTQEG